MNPAVDVLALYRTWTPNQRDLFTELVTLSLAMQDRGDSGKKIAATIRRIVKHRSHPPARNTRN